MENTVNTAAGQAVTAEPAFESVPEFAFAPEAVAQPAAQGTKSAGQKGAGAVDAQRSADVRGNEPHKDFALNRFQRPQKDIGKAFDLESQRVKDKAEREYSQKLEADPMRKFAKMMVTDLMRNEGITEEQALMKIENGFFASIAERDGVAPGVARMLYAQQQHQQETNSVQAAKAQDTQGQQATDSTQQEADAIVGELMSIKLPEGFDLEAAFDDMEFTELLAEYPAKAAVEVYTMRKQLEEASQAAQTAPQQLADKLRSRAEVPQSSRSSAASAEPDYKHMSRDDFIKFQRDNHLI